MSFSKSRAGLACCRRLRWDFDPAPLLAELDPGLWSREEVSEAAGRYRSFLVGARGDHRPLPTPQHARLPAAVALLARLPGELRRAHYSRLEPRGKVSVHKDGGERWDFYDGTIRLHLPLRTSPGCAVYADGALYRMAAGELWMLDNLREHGVINDAPEARLHLIVDLVPDERLLALARDPYPEAVLDAPALLARLRRPPGIVSRARAFLRRLRR